MSYLRGHPCRFTKGARENLAKIFYWNLSVKISFVLGDHFQFKFFNLTHLNLYLIQNSIKKSPQNDPCRTEVSDKFKDRICIST